LLLHTGVKTWLSNAGSKNDYRYLRTWWWREYLDYVTFTK